MPASSRFKVPLMAFALLSMSACGFTPVYDTKGIGIGAVEIDMIDGRTGYFLRQELVRRASLEAAVTDTSSQSLKIALTSNSVPIAIRASGFGSRAQMTVTARYSFISAKHETPIAGSVSTMVAYDSLDQAYGDVALQADAEERAAAQLADLLWFDLARRVKAPPPRALPPAKPAPDPCGPQAPGSAPKQGCVDRLLTPPK